MTHIPRECLLAQSQVDWLGGMAAYFGLPNSGKAFRCCLNWAAQTDRPLDGNSSGGSDGELVRTTLAATEGQWAWLGDRLPDTFGVSVLVGECMAFAALENVMGCEAGNNAASIFKVVRCKTKTGKAPGAVADVATAATQCEGAQAALYAATAPAAPAPAAAAAAAVASGCSE